MAQISADLGFHWVNIWYKNNRRQIDREILLPYGFSPKEDQPVAKHDPALFLPLGACGYALHRIGQTESCYGDEWEDCKLFDLDESFFGGMENLESLKELDERFGSLISDG